jgi:hypothetical protein
MDTHKHYIVSQNEINLGFSDVDVVMNVSEVYAHPWARKRVNMDPRE